jgi:hypothetical protein
MGGLLCRLKFALKISAGIYISFVVLCRTGPQDAGVAFYGFLQLLVSKGCHFYGLVFQTDDPK